VIEEPPKCCRRVLTFDRELWVQDSPGGPELGGPLMSLKVVVQFRALVTVGAAVAALAACSGQSTAGVSPTQIASNGSPTTTGTLQGHLFAVGGLAPGARLPWAGTVTITGTAFHREIRVGADGFYSLVLAPGRYVVTGRSPNFDDGKTACPAAHDAQVAAGVTVTIDAVCALR